MKDRIVVLDVNQNQNLRQVFIKRNKFHWFDRHWILKSTCCDKIIAVAVVPCEQLLNQQRRYRLESITIFKRTHFHFHVSLSLGVNMALHLYIQTTLTFRSGNKDSCYLLNTFSTFDRLDEETGVYYQTCPLTCALYLYVISEILEDETASDYDTNATLKAKTLYKSCIDTGKNCLNSLRVRLYWSETERHVASM